MIPHDPATTRRGFSSLAFGAAAASAAGAMRPGAAAAQSPTILQVIDAGADMSRFAALIRAAGLERLFTQPGPIGVFVPHNAAVERLSAHRLRQLEQDPEALRRTIRHHVTDFTRQILAGGFSDSSSGSRSETARALDGATLTITHDAGSLPRVDGAPVFVANMRAANGMAHCIDAVLEP